MITCFIPGDLADQNDHFLKKFLHTQISYKRGSCCLLLQIRVTSFLLWWPSGPPPRALRMWLSFLIHPKAVPVPLLYLAEATLSWQNEKPAPLLPCFGAAGFVIKARGNASLGTLQLLGIIVPFACQGSADIFSFPCFVSCKLIWIYVESDTLDKYCIISVVPGVHL